MISTLSKDGEKPELLEDVSRVQLEFDSEHEYRCKTCSEYLADYGGGKFEHESGSCDDPQPERIPLSWANSAAISLNEEDDSITLLLSVGDPRGAFAFTIRRMPDTAAPGTAGRLIMYVPYPGESFAHMKTVQVRDGMLQIGE